MTTIPRDPGERETTPQLTTPQPPAPTARHIAETIAAHVMQGVEYSSGKAYEAAYRSVTDKLTNELDKLLARPDGEAEPVAWRIQIGDSDTWGYTETETDADWCIKQGGRPNNRKEPLYAKPDGEAVRAEIIAIIEAQPFYPDTNVGMRQQWVKDQIVEKIKALGPYAKPDGEAVRDATEQIEAALCEAVEELRQTGEGIITAASARHYFAKHGLAIIAKEAV